MSNLTLVKILAKSVYPFWNNSSFCKCSLTFWREFSSIASGHVDEDSSNDARGTGVFSDCGDIPSTHSSSY